MWGGCELQAGLHPAATTTTRRQRLGTRSYHTEVVETRMFVVETRMFVVETRMFVVQTRMFVALSTTRGLHI